MAEIKIVHQEGSFETQTGEKLFEQWWLPGEGHKALVMIVHGLAEHSGRYDFAARYLCRHGYAVGAFDLLGHGKSSGKRAFIPAFNQFLDSVDLFLARAREKANGKPLFLFGHSMGGGITIKYLIERTPKINGALVSGSLVMVGESVSPMMIKIANILGALAPNLPTMQLDGSTVSRLPEVVEHYDRDPLNFRGKLPARTAAELNRATQSIQANLSNINLPILIMHGTEDKLVNPAGSKMVYEKISSKDKTLKLYEGLYHEILNEPEKEQVLDDMIAWMEAHMA